MLTQVQLYDTTLRDGAQREGISFTVEDKIRIARKLDELGVHFIEGGWPGSNPKDEEFFSKAQSLDLSFAILVAFGSTRRPKVEAEKDPNLSSLLDAKTEVVTIVGKSWDLQVTQVLDTTLDENLRMIADSIGYLKSKGKRVFFDAEHFFDGYKANASYAIETLKVASEAGAECLVLCDTNGGTMSGEITSACDAARKAIGTPLGIHAHNDAELAVANTLAAIQAGAIQAQGTINGYGERCGNANLCSIIPALKLKMGIDCISDEQLARLSEVAHYVSEIANLTFDSHLPYVGASAFAHKGGLHVDAMMKWGKSYQHIDPALVGNEFRTLVSELSGKKGIIYKAREQGLEFIPEGEEARATRRRLRRVRYEQCRFVEEIEVADGVSIFVGAQYDAEPHLSRGARIDEGLASLERRIEAFASKMGDQSVEVVGRGTRRVEMGTPLGHRIVEDAGAVGLEQFDVAVAEA